jgi:uncharacterized protein YndB with AHSA1/START domain
VTVVDLSTLRLERTYEATPEEVFDAWTNPEVLRRWWATEPGLATPAAEVDLRVGGGYRLSMEGADGALHTVRGSYREVSRPERLVYTWAWEEEDGSTGHESTVTVSFIGAGGSTTLVVEHTDLPSAESRDRHGEGWAGCLDSLARNVFAPGA